MGKSLLAASVLETLASKIGVHGFLRIAVEGDQELTCPSADTAAPQGSSPRTTEGDQRGAGKVLAARGPFLAELQRDRNATKTSRELRT